MNEIVTFAAQKALGNAIAHLLIVSALCFFLTPAALGYGALTH